MDRPSPKCHAISRRALLAAAVVGVPVTAAGFLEWRGRPTSTSAEPTTRLARRRRETRPTLDPSRFVGKAALAHAVARDMPDVLDELYCYCECDKTAGHVSLLSCYTDGHAAT
jgi:hypothetical protein